MDEVTEVSGSVTLEPKRYPKKTITVIPTPVTVSFPEPVIESISIKPIKYKMNLYTNNGLLRAEISRGIFADMSRRHGDIIRAIPSSYACTMDDIIKNYDGVAKRLRIFVKQTPEHIKNAVTEMVEAGLIIMK